MRSGSPTISVVIPCFNQGAFLEEALDSVRAQTFQDFEVLVIDDGSTDLGTRALLAGLRRPGVAVVVSENRGLSGARNLGASQARGEFLCLLDADDRLAPQYMARSLEVLRADPSLAFASHWLETFGDEHWRWAPERCDLPTLLDFNPVNGAALVRREALLSVGGFDESMRHGCEDWELWIRMVKAGHRGAIIPEVLHYYRRHAGAMTRAMSRGDVLSGLYGTLARKHPDLFRAHLPALAVRRDRQIDHLLQHNHDLELEHRRLLARLARRRQEREALAEKLKRRAGAENAERILARLREAEQAQRAVRAEADALRQSMSWQVTAPVRGLYDLVARKREAKR